MKTAGQVFKDSKSLLHELYQRSKNLTELQKIVLKYLPEQVYTSSYEGGTLHLVTTHSSLATRIRYDTKLVGQLAADRVFTDLKAIKISVIPDDSRPPKLSAQPLPVTKENTELLLHSSSYISDECLKRALINLANTISQDKSQNES